MMRPQNCADCTRPVEMQLLDGVPAPVDGRFDGDDVCHDACHAARCPGTTALGCGEPLGVACSHRQRNGDAWGIAS